MNKRERIQVIREEIWYEQEGRTERIEIQLPDAYVTTEEIEALELPPEVTQEVLSTLREQGYFTLH